MRDSNITPQFVEDMVDRVIDQLANKLEQLDISLDYIAALLAGIPAGDIGTRQARAGRSATDIPLAMKNLKESNKMKLTKARLKRIIKEELEGSSETDVIDDFLSAPVGEESSGLTEGQMELWFTLQNAEMIASLAVGAAAVGILGITGLKALGAKALKFLEDRQINAREAARAAREKAEEEQAEAELVLLTDFLLEDPTFVAALDGLVTSGSRKDVIAFNKSVRGKIKELGSMMNTSPAVLLKRLRKKAGAGDIEQRVVSDFEEKVSSANPEQDAEALRKAEPASLPSRQRQKIKESKKGKKMKLTKAKLKQIIKEELEGSDEADSSGGYKVLLDLAGEYEDSIFIKNAAEVSSPKPDILIIDHIEINLQYGLKVLKIEKV